MLLITFTLIWFWKNSSILNIFRTLKWKWNIIRPLFLNFRFPPYGSEEWIEYGYYPKNFAIIFILIIALYTCIPLPPKICLVTGILVSVAHFAALITEYVIVTNGKNEEKIDETSEYTSYMYRLVSYFYGFLTHTNDIKLFKNI